MTIAYVPGKGIYVTLPGATVLIPETWTIAAIERHLRELSELYE